MLTPVVQRKVRIDRGRSKVDEPRYRGDGEINGRFSTRDLIDDDVRRTFDDAAEFEAYARGETDYIGDVNTGSAGKFWFRLPRDELTVLGETHGAANGTVRDVIIAFGTRRFKYEPFNYVERVGSDEVTLPGTSRVLEEGVERESRRGLPTSALFNPALESVTAKAMAAVADLRGYIHSPGKRNGSEWKGRSGADRYASGERVAHGLMLAIEIADDIARHDFGAVKEDESAVLKASRALQAVYAANREMLTDLRRAKRIKDGLGIYELLGTKQSTLDKADAFAIAFLKYGALRIEEFGRWANSQALILGARRVRDPPTSFVALEKVREAFMLKSIKAAEQQGFLLVGMGSLHVLNLDASLPYKHGLVPELLTDAKTDIDAHWDDQGAATVERARSDDPVPAPEWDFG